MMHLLRWLIIFIEDFKRGLHGDMYISVNGVQKAVGRVEAERRRIEGVR